MDTCVFKLVLTLTVSHPTLQIVVSKKWGFTKYSREEYERMRAEGLLVPDGVGVQYTPNHGPLEAWKQRVSAA